MAKSALKFLDPREPIVDDKGRPTTQFMIWFQQNIGGVLKALNDAQTANSGLTQKQPLDADLTAIANLATNTGLLRKTAADTWALDTSVYAKAINDLSDVDTMTVAPATGQVLKWNGTNWVPAADDAGTASTVTKIDDLTDVDTVTNPPTGDVYLKWNGVNWVPSALPAGVVLINDLGDVDTVTVAPSTNSILKWNGTQWVVGALPPAGAIKIDDLTDVDTATVAPVNGKFLKFNGTNWVPGDSGAGATNLDGLSDVDTTTTAPTTGQVLKFNGTLWVPGTDNEGTGGGGSSSWYTKPLAADFPTKLSGNATLPTTTDHVGGLLINGGPKVTGDVQRVVLKNIPSPAADWSVSAKLRITNPSVNFNGSGLALRNSTSGKIELWRKTNSTDTTPSRLGLQRLPGLTGYTSDPFICHFYENDLFLRIKRVGANLIYMYSMDGIHWVRLYGEALSTNWADGAPNQVGFGFASNSAGPDPDYHQTITCEHWVQSF